MQSADSADKAHGVVDASVPREVVFVLLIAVAGVVECLKLSALRDPEIWGHLRIGSWILEHRSLPETGVFSQAANLPWRDFSWGFDSIFALAYRILGLRVIPVLLVASRLALATIAFLLAGGWRNFWSAAFLSAIAQYTLFSIVPLAGFVSLLFFGLELLLLFEARESGNQRLLFALPALFVLWANLDLGFVYGIVLYSVFLGAILLETWSQSRKWDWLDYPATRIPLAMAIGIGAACLFTSCATPNTVHAYTAFFAGEFSPINKNLSSYHAMGFRQPQDYLLMLLAMAAFLSLGLLRSRNVFSIGLLCGGAALAFYGQRNNWLLALVSAAVIGRSILSISRSEATESFWRQRQFALAGTALVLTFLVFAIRAPRDPGALLVKTAEKLPVHAADFLRQHPQPSPLFNCYPWGDFLTWYLPEYPVALDARRGLYPEQQELDYFQVMNAEIPYRNFPPLNNARTVLLDKAGVMGEAFRGVTGFHVLYEDDIAIIYSHEVKE